MTRDADLRQLLVEIRDLEREHLAEYRRVTGRSLELEERAVRRQEQLGRLYKAVLLVTALVAGGLIAFLAYFLAHLALAGP
jgi:hypothetical protein